MQIRLLLCILEMALSSIKLYKNIGPMKLAPHCSHQISRKKNNTKR